MMCGRQFKGESAKVSPYLVLIAFAVKNVIVTSIFYYHMYAFVDIY